MFPSRGNYTPILDRVQADIESGQWNGGETLQPFSLAFTVKAP